MILDRLYRSLSRLYHVDAPPSLQPFMISADTLRHIGGNIHCREQVLASVVGNHLSLGLYVDPSVIAHLDQHPPFSKVGPNNWEEFCLAIEGVSHALCILWKWKHNQVASQLELEIQAEVDKFLMVTLLLLHQGGSAQAFSEKLFSDFTLHPQLDGETQRRYLLATELARPYCEFLYRRFLRTHRIDNLFRELHHFYIRSHWQKLRYLG